MGWQTLSLPKRSETFKRSIHKSICRIGVRQPIIFRRVQNPSLVSVVPTELFCWASHLPFRRVQNPSLVSVVPTELFCWASHLPFRRVQNPSLVSVVPTELFCWASHLPFRRVQTRR